MRRKEREIESKRLLIRNGGHVEYEGGKHAREKELVTISVQKRRKSERNLRQEGGEDSVRGGKGGRRGKKAQRPNKQRQQKEIVGTGNQTDALFHYDFLITLGREMG